MSYVVKIHATFRDKVDADHVYTQLQTVAMHASVARIGESGERTSWAAVYEEQPNGALVPLERLHIDRFGIVRDGQLLPEDQVPAWVHPSGSHDAYPGFDVTGNPARVTHNGQVWENAHGDGNIWEPGVFGWRLA